MTLGKRIGRYRKKLGLTQEALAQKLNVTNQAVSKWESGQCCPDIALLPRIADVFGITMDELFGRMAPVGLMVVPQPEPEPEPEPVFDAEPVFEQEHSHEEYRRGNWQDSFWGRLFGKTIKDFEHMMRGIDGQVKDIEDGIERQVKDIERKREKDFGKRGGFSSRKEPVREQKLPEDVELPWEDDQTLRVALFVGKKLIEGHPARSRIQFCWNGPAMNVYSECSVSCGSVGGNVWAGDDVSCDTVGGSVSAGGDVSCGDITGNVDAGGDVDGGDIRGDVRAAGDLDCGDVLGNVSAGGDVSCGDIQGNLSSGGDVDCGHVEGFVSAGGDVSMG